MVVISESFSLENCGYVQIIENETLKNEKHIITLDSFCLENNLSPISKLMLKVMNLVIKGHNS